VRDGLKLFEEPPCNAPTEVLLATDLHAGNVLRSKRGPSLTRSHLLAIRPMIQRSTCSIARKRLCSDPDGVIRRRSTRWAWTSNCGLWPGLRPNHATIGLTKFGWRWLGQRLRSKRRVGACCKCTIRGHLRG
jgi:hypothetical protein